jgi:hypothetical protein
MNLKEAAHGAKRRYPTEGPWTGTQIRQVVLRASAPHPRKGEAAFGGYLHHTPDEAMATPMGDALGETVRAWDRSEMGSTEESVLWDLDERLGIDPPLGLNGLQLSAARSRSAYPLTTTWACAAGLGSGGAEGGAGDQGGGGHHGGCSGSGCRAVARAVVGAGAAKGGYAYRSGSCPARVIGAPNTGIPPDDGGALKFERRGVDTRT